MSQNPGTSFLTLEPVQLTHSGANGVYQRDVAVETRLREILQIDEAGLLALLRVKAKDDERFLPAEILVYLMREASLARKNEFREAIAEILYQRCEKTAARQARRAIYNDDAAAECAANILQELFAKLGDVVADKADFAQVRFNLFFKRIINNQIQQTRKILRQDLLADSLDEPQDEDAAPLEIEAKPEMSYESREFIDKALQILPPDIRQAFLLRHRAGWQIESADPTEMTISKYFGKTEKTIRNWLKKADDLLREWRDEQK